MKSSIIGQSSVAAHILSLKALRHHRSIVEYNCPGTLIDDEYYITDPQKDLSSLPVWESICTLHYDTTDNTVSPAMAIVGTFSCVSQGLVLDCFGKIVNPNYVFWDDASKSFFSPTLCTSEFSSCHEVEETNQCIENNFSCGGGEYVCQHQSDLSWCKGTIKRSTPAVPCPPAMHCDDLMESFAMIAHEDASQEDNVPVNHCDCTIHGGTHYSCMDDVQVCEGEFLRDWYCPPYIVSSIHEVEHYCSREYHILDQGTKYSCRFHGEEVCDGILDYHQTSSYDPTKDTSFGTELERPMTSDEAIRSWRLSHGLPGETETPLYKEILETNQGGWNFNKGVVKEDGLMGGPGPNQGKPSMRWSLFTIGILCAMAIVGLLQFRRRRMMNRDLEGAEAIVNDAMMTVGEDGVVVPAVVDPSEGCSGVAPEDNGYEMTELGTFT